MDTNNFKIVIPVYNSEKWIRKTILSIVHQSYSNWKAIIIDDASTDSTLDVAKKTINESGTSNFRLAHRTVRVGALENTVYGTNNICSNDEDIIVIVDGDDWLYNKNVLSYLNEVYSDENIWLTYGSYVDASSGKIGYINGVLSDTVNYRQHINWCTSHLRTYKFKLWKKIQDVDLRDSNGNYYRITGDLAVMFPMIEMCGIKRIKYIETPLYVYNDINPLNDNRKDPRYQLTVNAEIRRKSKYKEIV